MKCKADIEYHGLGHGYARVPAVNVKVHKTLEQGYREWRENNPDADERFTMEWIDENVNDDRKQQLFWFTCEIRWEDLQSEAEEIFGRGVKVYSEGRSGGWAYINGINQDTSDWDAIEFGKWRKWAKHARATADYIMHDMVDGIYNNEFDAWCDEQVEIRDEQSELAAPEIPEAFVGIA